MSGAGSKQNYLLGPYSTKHVEARDMHGSGTDWIHALLVCCTIAFGAIEGQEG